MSPQISDHLFLRFGGIHMFGGRRTEAQLALVSELSKINDSISNMRSELAMHGQDLKFVRTEQSRHDDRLGRIETDVHAIKPVTNKVDELSQRIATVESKVSDLSTWKTVESAKWTGPQKVIAVIGALIPILMLIGGAVAWIAPRLQ